jgi:hypothetical protein
LPWRIRGRKERRFSRAVPLIVKVALVDLDCLIGSTRKIGPTDPPEAANWLTAGACYGDYSICTDQRRRNGLSENDGWDGRWADGPSPRKLSLPLQLKAKFGQNKPQEKADARNVVSSTQEDGFSR